MKQIRESASPDESTVATWNIRSHYGSPEDIIDQPKSAENE